MTKRKNDFIWVKQFFIKDKNEEMSCWVDEDELEDFKTTFSDSFEEGDLTIEEERSIRGRDWNLFIISYVDGTIYHY